VARVINDLQGKKPQLLNDNAANNAIVTYQNKIQAQKSKPTIEKKLLHIILISSFFHWLYQ